MSERACGVIANGYFTDVVVKFYSNQTLLIISHFKKIGTLLTVRREPSVNNFNGDIFTIKTLFGNDDNNVHAAARYIAQQINIDRPLLLSLALKDYSIETLRDIVPVVNRLLW